MEIEINDKTLNVLIDRWFVKAQWSDEIFESNRSGNSEKYSLVDFTVTNDSNLKVKAESLTNIGFKAKLKAELKVEFQQESRK